MVSEGWLERDTYVMVELVRERYELLHYRCPGFVFDVDPPKGEVAHDEKVWTCMWEWVSSVQRHAVSHTYLLTFLSAVVRGEVG